LCLQKVSTVKCGLTASLPNPKSPASPPGLAGLSLYALLVTSQYFGEIVVNRWFRYGSGTAPLPTQPPVIEKLPLLLP
jgi:hypothetical protein